MKYTVYVWWPWLKSPEVFCQTGSHDQAHQTAKNIKYTENVKTAVKDNENLTYYYYGASNH